MARRDLPESLIQGGQDVLAATDALAMAAQGAMWIYDSELEDWRYYLVTSLVDTLGRRRTYKLLLDVFEKAPLPEEMTIEDVHLGSPSDPFFQFFTSFIRFDNGIGRFHDCRLNDVSFDGVIYRSVSGAPPAKDAQRIEKLFTKKVRDLVTADH